ncbi:MAG: M48 family metallopeptidase [Candidatus Nealsonbacteria bacterium]
MKRDIILKNKRVSYRIRKSKRARRLRLAVYCDGSVVVTQPRNISFDNIESFIKIKSDWILAKLNFFSNFKRELPKSSYKDYLEKKQKAFDLVVNKIEKFNKIYKLKFNKINIKNQKTRWGSCSQKGNLNFNYRIIYLPDKFIDYIIIHELFHLREFNHSRKFWNLIKTAIPDYLNIKKELRNKGM